MRALGLMLALPLLSGPVSADTTFRQLDWRDLTIPVDSTADPYFDLDLEQRKLVEELLDFERERQKVGNLIDPNQDRPVALVKELRLSGLDPQQLIQKERTLRAKIVAQRSMVRVDLDGKKVRIPGFVLPLEFEGGEVSEFLLVPYAGACIHTPPPPANQIIHVRTSASFELESNFMPVWVSGELSVEATQQSVGLSDGEAGFDVGYAIQANEIAAYER